MTRKKKFMIAGAILAALVILGTIGGIALADNSTTTTTTSVADKFAAKVAAILGIDQTKVQAAFDQAQTELRSEQLDAWLAQMVTDGKITQAQADAYKTWMNSKPSGIDGIGPGGMMGRGGRGGFGGGCGGFGVRNGNQTSTTTTN
ncbi:MAG: hypothetical protein PHE50_08540 [Dehalococcoidales bacterium]|nr:hypothetical protein [Dehalococcoidales bacterium]